jgi:hypothetical protein
VVTATKEGLLVLELVFASLNHERPFDVKLKDERVFANPTGPCYVRSERLFVRCGRARTGS